MFFCPDESGDKEYGWVQMDMLHQIGDKKLENVAVVILVRYAIILFAKF